MEPLIAAELNRLESEGIIESVNAADVAWLTLIIAVRKANNKIRLCGSYDLTLNPHIDSDFYKIPDTDDIFHKISGCQFFSKIDMYQAFFNIPLNDANKKFTAINTPCGVYLFNVLPYGIKSSPGIFNDFVQNTLIKDLVNVHAFYDDVIIASSSREENIKDLHTFLSRCLDYNVTLNRDKCAFFRREIEFLGNVISSSGITPSESKVEAICKAKKPSNVTELRSFLRLVNFLSRFVPKLSIVLKPLYFLLRKDTVFTWDKLANDSFDKCKDLIAKSILLSPFSIKDRLVIYIDAAKVGIAAILGKTENNIFREGEEVWAREFNKDILWGPAKILRKKGRVLYDIKLSDGRKATRHVDQLRKRSCSNLSVRVPVHVPVSTSLEPETQSVAQPPLEARTTARSRAAPARLIYHSLGG